MQEEATAALQQIHSNQYATQAKQCGITNLIYIAIAFCEREIVLASEVSDVRG